MIWRGSVSPEPAWMLGFQEKRTDLHKKYVYPELGDMLHGELGWTLLASVVGHIGMAFWHRRSGTVNVLPRMLG